MYLNVMIGMYNPNGMQAMQELANMKLSGDMLKGLGFDLGANLTPNLIHFIAQYYYGLLVFAFPLIYIIAVSNRLIVSNVDNGSMAYIVSTPNTRLRFVVSQALFLLVTTWLLVVCITLVGIMQAEKLFPGLLSIPDFIRVNIGAGIILTTISGIGFASSCIFNESSKAIATATGIPIAFLLIQVLSNISPDSAYLKSYTFFTLFDTNAIIANYHYIADLCILAAMAATCYIGGIWYFITKDLPL